MTSTPRYTATVTNQTRGWSYTMTHKQAVSDVPDVQLADELEYRWGFASDQLPGQLEAPEATVRLWARDASHVPVCEKGDRITIDLRMGAAGSRILAPAAMRVAAADLELTDHAKYSAKLVVRLIDPASELPARIIAQGAMGEQGITTMNTASMRWRVRFAEVALRLARTIACPTWWSDDERPAQTSRPNGAGNLLRGLDQPTPVDTGVRVGLTGLFLYPYPASDVLARLLNSHHPSGIAHTLIAGWQSVGSTFPAGWRRIGPDTYWNPYNDANATSGPNPSFVEPQTSDRYYVVPASRAVDAATTYLPLVFAVAGGVLTLQPNPSATSPRGHRPLGIDAAWCQLPATFRKAREHAPNVINMHGQESFQQTSGSTPTVRDAVRAYANTAAQTADGTVLRELETALDLGTAAADYHTDPDRFTSVEAPIVAAAALTDDTQRTSWTPDTFTVRLSLMPDAVAASVAPRICPRQPGETDGDAQVARHAVVYRLPDSKRFTDGNPVAGFVVRGVMKVINGDVVWQLVITPGLPRYVNGTAPAPITVAQVDAASYQAQQCSTIDPRIRVADLAHVAS